MNTNNLPPLPSPMYANVGGEHLYTSNQMREYGQLCRQQTLRDAAKSIDEIDDREAPEYRHCQEHIRSLK